MSGERRWGSKRPPQGFDTIEPVLRALEAELRKQVDEPHEGKRRVETTWPIHQLNWQKTRYVFDMYHRYHRIEKPVFDYCIKEKLIDAQLAAKWKKPGYERLCSVHAVNPRNFNFGTVDICRVPRHDLPEEQIQHESKFNGCRGCATGKGGKRNIFGNKYGQWLAAVQVRREEKARAGDDVEYDSVWATPEEEKLLRLDEDSGGEEADGARGDPGAKRRRV
eukprot:TRINITY_DN61189_c0_g1_i1.p1 TRINITY_DN61189_c0_g1~~TRINITY_DN61189_c0_g1_i1.p1  ORF type:complete len:246 (+),score=94.70 TRINITY_DN61189_c0_g1_i1:77-739(+)